ncbi:MAG: hypothetical protein AB7O65_12780, partial [Candidatus Korobacteraceae bacterium]
VVRHAIMQTTYRVSVVRSRTLAGRPPRRTRQSVDANWFSREHALQLPLTGLARKILRRVFSDPANEGTLNASTH